MKVNKRTLEIEIEIERSRRILLTKKSGSATFCDICSHQARSASPDIAAGIARVTPRALFRLLESGNIHFTEDTHGRILVCLGTLLLELDKTIAAKEIEHGGENENGTQ